MITKTKTPAGNRGLNKGTKPEGEALLSDVYYTPNPPNFQYARLTELEKTLGRPRCRQIAAKLKFSYPPARRNQSVLLVLMLEADARNELQITERGVKFVAGRGKQ